jgi:hypothetical protein
LAAELCPPEVEGQDGVTTGEAYDETLRPRQVWLRCRGPSRLTTRESSLLKCLLDDDELHAMGIANADRQGSPMMWSLSSWRPFQLVASQAG